MKLCLSCKATSSPYWYFKDTQCKNCYHRDRYTKNKESEKERSKAYRAANKEKIKNYHNTYRLAHKADYAFNTAKYRAAKLKRTPKWLTEHDWLVIDGFYREANRLTKETGIEHHVDHIIPLQGKYVSGLHVPSNLQILTYTENVVKSNKVQLD